MSLRGMNEAARRSWARRVIEEQLAHREYHNGAARFAHEAVIKHDPALCRSCHLLPKDREELCTGCLHAVRAHGVSPQTAYTVECDGTCDRFEDFYRHNEEEWMLIPKDRDDWESSLREMLDLTVAEEKAVQQQIEALTAQRTELLQRTLRYTQALGTAKVEPAKRSRLAEATDRVRAWFESDPDTARSHTQITAHLQATLPCSAGTAALAIADLFREGFLGKTTTGTYYRRLSNE